MTEVSVSGELSDAGLRRAFREYESGVALDNARRAAVFAGVFMLAASSLDWVIYPERAWEFLTIRASCAILLAVIFWYLRRSRCTDLQSRIAEQGIALAPLVAICWMIAETDGGNSVYYAGLNLILVGLSLLLRWTFWNSLAMILATFFCYTLSVLLSPTVSDFQILFGNSFFLFVTSVFVLVGSYFYERLRFSEFRLHKAVEISQEVMETQNRELSELDEAKTRFFANISHELRTPLTVVLGITERLERVLGRKTTDPVIREMTAMLEQNGLRLLKLIDDLLDLVRLDTGHAGVNRQPTPIKAHVEGLLRSLRHLAEQDKVALLWNCVTDSEAVRLDRDKFDRVLLNLVINAIKFTPSGGTIEVVVICKSGGLRLSVEDSGVGIPPDVLPRIFDRFWQVDTSSTRKFQGVGIGLAIVRSLTEAMDGTVRVDSKLGCGTTFTLELPAASEDVVEGGDEDPLRDGGIIAELHRRAALSVSGKMSPLAATSLRPPVPVIANRARPLVLIADDEPDIRRFLRMQLEDVDVIEAGDGAEALELTRLHRPQLALLDHMMPGMTGVELCKRIRGDYHTRGVAVIILTARTDEQTKLAALEAGANDFLTKPFSTTELALRLENQIAMAKIRREIMDLNAELHAALEQIKENEVLMVRNEKLSSLGRMSAGIIHEINNPLNYANAGLHALETFTKSLPERDRADHAEILGDIREGVERVSQIVIDLRQFTREEVTTTGEADLVEIVGRSRRMVSHEAGKEIAFRLSAPDQAPVRGNSNQLVQVFINFFQNSIDAIHQRIETMEGDPGEIEVSIEASGEGWQVAIRDNGIGIPAEDLGRIFDPFFTSKDVGKGMGLGLSISHQILKAHQAVIGVDSRPNEFTSLRIAFPAAGLTPEKMQDAPDSVLDQPA